MVIGRPIHAGFSRIDLEGPFWICEDHAILALWQGLDLGGKFGFAHRALRLFERLRGYSKVLQKGCLDLWVDLANDLRLHFDRQLCDIARSLQTDRFRPDSFNDFFGPIAQNSLGLAHRPLRNSGGKCSLLRSHKPGTATVFFFRPPVWSVCHLRCNEGSWPHRKPALAAHVVERTNHGFRVHPHIIDNRDGETGLDRGAVSVAAVKDLAFVKHDRDLDAGSDNIRLELGAAFALKQGIGIGERVKFQLGAWVLVADR